MQAIQQENKHRVPLYSRDTFRFKFEQESLIRRLGEILGTRINILEIKIRTRD